MYSENYEALMKEFENFSKKWKKKYYLIGKINVVKISILLKAVYRCNASGAGKATVTCLSMNWEHFLVAYTK